MNYIIKISIVLMVGLLAYSCGDDDTVVDPCDAITATYNGDVKAIINNSCAYFGCHNGSNGNIPESARDYTTFAGMAASVADGSFNTRVLEVQNMPNPDITPDDKPQELTAAQLVIIQCWHDAEYPEG